MNLFIQMNLLNTSREGESEVEKAALCSVLTLAPKLPLICLPLIFFFPCWISAAAAANLLQSCPTLCDPIDGSPPGSPVPGTLQARTLEWVAISFSNACKWKVKVKSLSHVLLFMTPRTTADQAPPSMGFSRQKYWSGVLLPSPIIGLFYGKTKVWLLGFY